MLYDHISLCVNRERYVGEMAWDLLVTCMLANTNSKAEVAELTTILGIFSDVLVEYDMKLESFFGWY